MKKNNKKKIIAVLPAFNAAKTLKKTLDDLTPNVVDAIILVDDASTDETLQVARKNKIQVYSHPMNRGYGANQKTCYTLAISSGADIIVLLHPDYQYDSSLVGTLVMSIVENKKDVMLGSRITTRKTVLAGGMPLYKYLGNRLLTLIENIILGHNLSEYHTGFRAFDARFLKKIPFHKYSDDFVFDQQILFGAIKRGARIGEIHVPVRYLNDSSSISFVRSCKYGLQILVDLFLFIIPGIKAY